MAAHRSVRCRPPRSIRPRDLFTCGGRHIGQGGQPVYRTRGYPLITQVTGYIEIDVSVSGPMVRPHPMEPNLRQRAAGDQETPSQGITKITVVEWLPPERVVRVDHFAGSRAEASPEIGFHRVRPEFNPGCTVDPGVAATDRLLQGGGAERSKVGAVLRVMMIT